MLEDAKRQAEDSRILFHDPVLFAKHILGVKLWDRQRQILRAIRKDNRTAVKASHGTGKTFTLAIAVLWWLTRYENGIVLTTSPTFRQVKTQLWAEIRRVASRSRCAFPKLKTTALKLRGEENFAIGLSTHQAENFQGYHGKQVLIVADEAPGIQEEIWDAVEGVMAGGKVHLVLAGNPTCASGKFFDAFNRERSVWQCFTIDAFASPNLAGLAIDDLLQMDPAEGGPLDKNPVPFLATRRWVYDHYGMWWHGDETSSPIWMSRVRGEFPTLMENALIKLAWLERAKNRARQQMVQDTGERLVAGVDVGGVDSETVVYVCEPNRTSPKIINLGAWRGEDTRGHAVAFLWPYHKRLAVVRVDADGVGHNFGLHLRDEGFPVQMVHVGVPVEEQPNLKMEDPARRFVNRKAQYYQRIADILEHDALEGLIDDLTIDQLSSLRYELDSRGRMKIESKEKARERGVPSPDRAEALMLALGEPPPLMEWTSIGQLQTQSRPHPVFDEDSPRGYSGLGTLLKSRKWGPGGF